MRTDNDRLVSIFERLSKRDMLASGFVKAQSLAFQKQHSLFCLTLASRVTSEGSSPKHRRIRQEE
jgi:hypothetical protein